MVDWHLSCECLKYINQYGYDICHKCNYSYLKINGYDQCAAGCDYDEQYILVDYTGCNFTDIPYIHKNDLYDFTRSVRLFCGKCANSFGLESIKRSHHYYQFVDSDCYKLETWRKYLKRKRGLFNQLKQMGFISRFIPFKRYDVNLSKCLGIENFTMPNKNINQDDWIVGLFLRCLDKHLPFILINIITSYDDKSFVRLASFILYDKNHWD